MADSVQYQSGQLATPASGTQVSTDDTASGHVQRVKLAMSADGSDAHVQADANGLLVSLGTKEDEVGNNILGTDIGITTKSVIFGLSSGGGGSYEPVKVTPSGALTVEATIEDGGGSLTVDGTVAATQSGSWTVGVSGPVPLPTGAATDYSLRVMGSNLSSALSGSNLSVSGIVDARQSGSWAVGITGPVTVQDGGGSLTVDGTVGVSGTVTVDGSGVTQPVSGTVTVQDGGGTLTVDGTVAATQSGTWTVGVSGTVPVSDGGSSLTVDGTVAVSGTVTVDGSGVTQPVSGTVTVQDGGSSLTVDGTVTVQDGGSSLTVDGTVAATQSGTWSITDVSGTISLPTGAATASAQSTIIGHLDGVEGLLTTIDADTSALAGTVSGSELQVDIVSAPTITVTDGGSSLTVDGTVAATQSGSWTVTANAGTGTYTVGDGGSSLTVDNSGTFAVQAAQSGTWNLTNISGTISLPTGAATETSLATVAAAVSGSNMRVTDSGLSLPISSSSAETYSVSDQATSTTLLDANASRKGWAVYNDSTAICYLKMGATASSTSYTVKLVAEAYFEQMGHGVYTGRVDAVWSTDATGAARVTEW